MRLRTTLVGVLVVIALVLSGTIYVGFALHKNDVRAQERQAVEQTATVVADRIDTWATTMTTTVELWATTLNTTAGGSGQVNSLRTLLDRTAFDTASVYATDGSLVAIVDRDIDLRERQLLVGTDYSRKPFVRHALSGRTYVSDIEQTPAGTSVVRIAAPIRNARGTVTGVVSANFEIGSATLFGNITEIIRDTEHVTITSDGRILFGGSHEIRRPISANATVAQTGWVVTVRRPSTVIADELRVATLMQIGGVAVGLLSIAIVGLWVSRTTFARIRDLDDALHSLESGEYRTDLDLGSIDEWRRINERFNTVSAMLEQRDSQLRVLNRVLRHNLRNDMNVVTSHAERALADEDVPPAIESDLEKIRSTAHRLLNTSEHARTLYDDLLSNPKQALEPVDVVSIVEDRVGELTSQFPEATIETDLPETAWALDSATLPIVIEEIARNALVHNDRPEADRRVAISVTSREFVPEDVDAAQEVRIDVEDNGPGIPMVEEALLTDRLEETAIDHGSGLGVWLVNWLLARIGGTVSVSTGVDRGTTVSIHVPAPDSPPDAVGDGDEDIPDGGDAGET